jgi:hypothetical protein
LVEVQQRQKNGKYKMKTCPKSFADYGKYRGGVDTANELRSYYERYRRSKKWWPRLFYSLLETTLVNSWICYKDLVKRNMANGDDKGKPHEQGASHKQRAGRIGRLAPKIHLNVKIKNQRRKRKLSVGKEMRFENVACWHSHADLFFEKRTV